MVDGGWDGGGGVGWDHLLIIIYLKYKNCIKTGGGEIILTYFRILLPDLCFFLQ